MPQQVDRFNFPPPISEGHLVPVCCNVLGRKGKEAHQDTAAGQAGLGWEEAHLPQVTLILLEPWMERSCHLKYWETGSRNTHMLLLHHSHTNSTKSRN